MAQSNLIVNYLPQTLTDEEFRSMFLSIGHLKSSKIVRDRATGYSYGFGFVDYVQTQDAQKAIQTLNGLQLQNKRIKVAYSRNGDNIKGGNLYITGLPKTMTQTELEENFVQYGEIIQSRILVDQGTGNSKGVGFVLFSNKDEAETARITMDGQVLPGGSDTLSVKFAEDNKGKAKPPPIVVVRSGGGGAPHGRGGGYNNNYHAGGGYGGGNAPGNFGGGYGNDGGYAPGPMRSQNQNRFRYNPMSGNVNSMGNGSAAAANTTSNGEGGFVLFVYNIGPTADERELWQLFSPFGSIVKVNVIRDHQKNQGKGYGFVTMTNYHDGMSAIQSLNGYRYAGKPLQVSFKSHTG